MQRPRDAVGLFAQRRSCSSTRFNKDIGARHERRTPLSTILEVAGSRIELVQGDITTERVDAIGNAANTALRGGGGVDGAIHRAAGPGLLEELTRRYPDGTPTGTAVATGGHRLPARWIIHAVGPIWRGGGHGEAELLNGTYRSSLKLADELGAGTVAFPAISMGIYGYPPEQGAAVALDAVRSHLASGTAVRLVRFVLFSDDTFEVFAAALGGR